MLFFKTKDSVLPLTLKELVCSLEYTIRYIVEKTTVLFYTKNKMNRDQIQVSWIAAYLFSQAEDEGNNQHRKRKTYRQ